MVSITGRMDLTIEGNFCQEWDMEEVFGIWSMEILTKESTWMIKKMEKEFIFGRMDQSMMATLRMTTDMVLDKWGGKMGEAIKDNGWTE